MAVVTIVGSGVMGSALAFPARENGNEVRLVGTHLNKDVIDFCKKTNRHPRFEKEFPEGLKYYYIEELEEALSGADVVIGGISSFGVEWFGDFVLPKIPESVPVLAVTKGLVDTEDGNLLCYPQVWKAKMDKIGKKLSINAIGGPCTSNALISHDHTHVSFCGEDMDILRKLKEIMATDYYHVSLSTDVIGIETAVALKNSFALGIALTVGIIQKEYGPDSELYYNSQAAVFGQAYKEMHRLLDLQGACNLYTMSVGTGDLFVTVCGGRTRLAGVLLGKGYTIDEAKNELKGVTLESLVVVERIARAIRVKAQKGETDLSLFPLLMHVDEIIIGKKEVKIPWEKFTYEN